MSPLEPHLESLSRFTTCDIGDALVKLSIPHGGFLSGLKMLSPSYCSGPTKILGPAHTVRMAHVSDLSPPVAGHFADTITQGSVVFVSQPDGMISACWGGLMSTRAAKLGAAGVVVDGRIRDINEHRELGLGVFARDTSVLGTAGASKCIEVGGTVSVKIGTGEVVVRQDDILVGDADGVVVVPVEAVERCVELCAERAEIDEKTMEALRRGEEMGATLKRLRK